jgi:hypothetical protein
MRATPRFAASFTAAALLSASAIASFADAAPLPVCEAPAFAFTPELRMGTTGLGYEPGIEIDSKGAIWTTAHKNSLVREEGSRLASFLWRSTDDGESFSDLEEHVPGVHAAYALEGDLAVDANDRMYFVDTWAGDNQFYRFGPDGTLETLRPVVPSLEIDDRPWLAAHHDGYVYYMSNTGYTPGGRLTIHRSTDRGDTFDPVGFTIPESGWGFLDADPNSDHVYAIANDLFYGTGVLGGATEVNAWISSDRGVTWSKSKIADYARGYDETADHDDAYPTVAVSPVDGTVYGLWTDDGRELMLSRSTDHGATWEVFDVSPFSGLYSYAWLTVGDDGDVGIVFQGRKTGSTLQAIYAMQWRPDAGCADADTAEACTGPASVTARVNRTRPISADPSGQADFFQSEISPTTGAHHVVWRGSSFQLYHARSTVAPSMAGSRFCGHHDLSPGV